MTSLDIVVVAAGTDTFDYKGLDRFDLRERLDAAHDYSSLNSTLDCPAG